jgi:thiol-disulfide isomerase/thioredoxin
MKRPGKLKTARFFLYLNSLLLTPPPDLMRIKIAIIVSLVIGLAIFLFIRFYSKNATFATVEIQVDKPADERIIVLRTVGGANFWANRTEVVLNNENSCSIKIPKEECGLILVRSDDFLARLIVFAGDKVHLNVHTSPAGKPVVTYTGDNAAGHTYFNSLQRAYIRDVDNPYANDTSAASIAQKIAAKEKAALDGLNALRSSHSISAAYADLARLDIRYYYAASLADAMYGKFFIARYVRKDSTLFKPEYAQLMQQAFRKMPLDNASAIQSQYYRELVTILFETRKDKASREQDMYNYFRFIEKNFSDTTGKYLEAQYLYYIAIRHNYEFALVELYRKFVRQYPGNEYIPYLQPEIDKILAFHQAAEQDFSKNQVFVKNYENISSLQELAGALKGAVYYVDIWATFCGPCKEEFKYNPQLTAMLGKNNVKALYISLDREQEDDDWKNMIRYYRLPGFHLRANDALKNDIFRKLGSHGTLAIPRYLIISNGEVVNADAARPGSIEKLQKQIGKLAS